MSFLEVQNLHINLGEFFLKEVFFNLHQRDYLVIIGPTGAGKTILLETIIGFWKPERGKIYLEGKDITNELPERRQVGIVYQDYALLPHFTVFENIAYGLKKKQKNNIKEKVEEMAASLQIDHLLHRKPATLSGGEQQRVALARALIVEPRLLLMDEPLSALDPQTRREARRLLRQTIQKRNTTVIHITHDLDDAWALANKVAVFRDGNLLQFDSFDEVFNRPQSRFIADFVDATIFEGKVTSRTQGVTTINMDGFNLASLDEAVIGERVKVAIRPENIIVSRSMPEMISAQNFIKATLEEIVREGKTCTLLLRINDTVLNVLVANNAIERLNLKPDDEVYALFKAAHVRIV